MKQKLNDLKEGKEVTLPESDLQEFRETIKKEPELFEYRLTYLDDEVKITLISIK